MGFLFAFKKKILKPHTLHLQQVTNTKKIPTISRVRSVLCQVPGPGYPGLARLRARMLPGAGAGRAAPEMGLPGGCRGAPALPRPAPALESGRGPAPAAAAQPSGTGPGLAAGPARGSAQALSEPRGAWGSGAASRPPGSERCRSGRAAVHPPEKKPKNQPVFFSKKASAKRSRGAPPPPKPAAREPGESAGAFCDFRFSFPLASPAPGGQGPAQRRPRAGGAARAFPAERASF